MSWLQIENRGQHNLLLDAHIDPLFLTLKNPAGGLKPYSSVQGQHGFQPAGNLSRAREFHDWLVLENEAAGESALVGGEPGLGVLGWKATTHPSSAGTIVRAGTILLKDKKGSPSPVFELAPGRAVETPITFFALAKGDTDDAGNETFRYLKQYVFLTPFQTLRWLLIASGSPRKIAKSRSLRNSIWRSEWDSMSSTTMRPGMREHLSFPA